MITRIHQNILLTLLVWIIIPAYLHAEVLVVTSAQSAITHLSQSQIRDIYLGRVSALPNGNSVNIIDYTDNHPLREEFYHKITHKTAAQAKAHWARLYFTGRAPLPYQSRNEQEVKKMLQLLPNSIGYMEHAALDNSIKILYVEP